MGYVSLPEGTENNPDAPWDCYIYLHEKPYFFSANCIGKYSIRGAYGYGFFGNTLPETNSSPP